MNPQDPVLTILKQTGALLQGHFILRSGLRSEFYLQCARIGENMNAIAQLAKLAKPKLKNIPFDTVLAPAMGALVFGQEIARLYKKRFVFLDKENNSLRLKRGFTFNKQEKILLVEDVITQGGRILEALQILQTHKTTASAVLTIIYRGQTAPKLPIPLLPLLTLPLPTYPPHALPPHLQQIPPHQPSGP